MARAGGVFTVENPHLETALAQVTRFDADDVDQAVAGARQAFDTGGWPCASATARGKVLLALAAKIREHAEGLARWETRQVGKPIRDAIDEVHSAADCFEFYAGAANKVYGHTIPVSAAGLDFTERIPLGVVALIVPWNFPLLIAAWKVAPALAAGNVVLVKPASYAPLTALLLGRLGTEAGLPAGVLNIVPGPGAEVGERLVEDRRVDKVAFTGETTTGTRILQLAAPQIKRVSLELGGKSPTLVFQGVDVERVAALAVQSAYGNAGQDCCARSRIAVDRAIYEQFVEAFCRQVQALRVGDPEDPATEVGPLVSGPHRERVVRHVERGIAEGAELLVGRSTEGLPDRGYYLAPTVFSAVDARMDIVRQEIFGPVTTIQCFATEPEAIEMANDTLYGLSGSVFSRDVGQAVRVARQLRAGVVSVNSIKSVHIEAPFGGFKQSGLGRELGMEAMELYTELRNIFIEVG